MIICRKNICATTVSRPGVTTTVRWLKENIFAEWKRAPNSTDILSLVLQIWERLSFIGGRGWDLIDS